MIDYTFQEGVPEGFTFDFEVGIFHDPRHLLLQSPSGWYTFSLTDYPRRLVVGMIHVHIQDDKAISPYRSPYGSFLFSETISEKQVIDFVKKVEAKLLDKQVCSFELKNRPGAYSKKTDLLEEVLHKLNYQHLEEISSVISVDQRNYVELLHRSKRARLKKCHDLGLHFLQLPSQDFESVYSFLKRCREEKGYSLSMSLSDLKHVLDIFPEALNLHVVKHEERFVSACISIRVERGMLYTFYYDHTQAFDEVSPVVMLMEGMFQFCQKQKIGLLDLGTSHVDGKLSQSLLDFKRSLGALPSAKRTFVKNLS
ncbi:MAG: GNAT family N-acetyltransferase [Cyclobacteriaceae bacterium]